MFIIDSNQAKTGISNESISKESISKIQIMRILKIHVIYGWLLGTYGQLPDAIYRSQ